MICGHKNLLSMTGRSWSLLLSTSLLIGVPLSEVKSGPPLKTVAEADEPKVFKPNSLQPNPDYSPADVIRIQLQALADNDHPYENAGIEVTFRFASPANKSATGPLERFIRMVQSPAYRPMLNHKAASYGELRIEGNQAAQAVVLTTSSGERIGYVFILSKQEGGICDKCWMTDGVLLFEVGEELRET